MVDHLFSNKKPTNDTGPALASESSAAYLRRSTRTRWVLLRDTYEDWYARYPHEHRADLRSRFHADDNGQHYGAFFELYCHELLLRHGYEVEIHAPGDPTTSNVPDFLVKRDGVKRFFFEATTAIGNVDVYKNEKRLAPFIDSLNSMPLSGYCLSIRVDEWDTSTPSFQKAKSFLLGIHGQFATRSRDVDSDYVFTQNGWRIRFRFIPVSKPLSRTIGIQTSQVLYDNIDVPLRRAIRAKSSNRYGDLELPYIVAVNSIDSVATEFAEVEEVLLSSSSAQRGVGEWGAAGAWRKIGQSGLLFAEELLPWTIFTARLNLWVHPGAKHPFDRRALNITCREFSSTTNTNHWKTVHTSSINELLGIPAEAPLDS